MNLSPTTSLMGMSGAGGWAILTNEGSPHTIDELIVGAVTTQAGITISGTQLSNNDKADKEFTDYEIDSSGQYDPLWSQGNVITVPSGQVKIVLG